MFETRFPRIRGDIGNASTFSFPVLYKVVRDVSPLRLIVERDLSILDAFIEAGKALLDEGIKAIVTSCGFLALFHRELCQAFHVPVYSSSLIQIPLVYAVTDRRVGVLTTDDEKLSESHFEAVGSSGIPIAVEGIKNTYFWNVLSNDLEELDLLEAEHNVVQSAKRLVKKNKDIGAIVLECTNFPPFARAIQDAVDLPIFDIVTLTNMAHESMTRTLFREIEL